VREAREGRVRGWIVLVSGILLSLLPGGPGAPLGALPAGAQIAPDESWRARTTEHFRIVYPEPLASLVDRTAVRAEAAYRALEEAFGAPSSLERIDLVLTDASDATTGFADLFPTSRVQVGVVPPTQRIGLAYFDDWLEIVLVHEIAHIFHLERTGGLGRVVRTVFGRVPAQWPTFPGLGTPRWVREGLATYYESAMTGAGRTHGTFHDMVVRTAVLEGAFEELDEVSGQSPVWPAGTRPYAYGSLFFDRLLEEHGDERMSHFADAVADQIVPYRLNSAAKDAFEESFSEAWREWYEEVDGSLGALRDSLALRAPITEPEPLSREGRFALFPEAGPTGTVVYARSDGKSDAQLAARATGARAPGAARASKLARTNGSATFTWLPDGRIVFSQLDFVDPHRTRGDLYLLQGEGEVRRLTRKARLSQPAATPDGSSVIAVQEGGGTNRLVELDLEGGDLRALTPEDLEVHWAHPRVSPDGRWIAVSRWRTDRSFDVVILDREGRLLHTVTEDRSVDFAPAWSPDGRWLVWGSDRSGIWNVLAVPVDPERGKPGPPIQLTNVLTGAAYPSVSPDGRWLYFSGYHAHGWQVERIPFRPDEGFEPFPLDPRFRTEAGTGGGRRRVASGNGAGEGEGLPVRRFRPDSVPATDGPYSPLATLRPQYWQPTFDPSDRATVIRDGRAVGRVDVIGTGVGVITSGQDVVERHGYAFRGTLTPRDGRFQGFLSYTFRGLGNPSVGIVASQTLDAAPGSLVGRRPDGTEELLFLTERERGVTLFSRFLRRRMRSFGSLEVAGSYIREQRDLLNADLNPSRRFNVGLPTRDLLQARITLSGDNARVHPFSISREDGIGGSLQLRARQEINLPDTLSGALGTDRSFQDAVGRVRAYKGFPLFGFANHAVALRATGGVARDAGADAFHYEVGGATGRIETVSSLGLFGGSSVLFPVRGFREGDRFGRYAWSASAEYRVPIVLAHEGLGLLPLYFDRIAGSLFVDVGNAWGPELESESRQFRNPRQEPLVSAGGELLITTLPFFTTPLTVRTGLAFLLQGRTGTSGYVRLGVAF